MLAVGTSGWMVRTGAQDDERAQLLAQIRPGEGQTITARHLAGRS